MATTKDFIELEARPVWVIDKRLRFHTGAGQILDGMNYDATWETRSEAQEDYPFVQFAESLISDEPFAGAHRPNVGFPLRNNGTLSLWVGAEREFGMVTLDPDSLGEDEGTSVVNWVARVKDAIVTDTDGDVDVLLEGTLSEPLVVSSRQLSVSQLGALILVEVGYRTAPFCNGQRRSVVSVAPAEESAAPTAWVSSVPASTPAAVSVFDVSATTVTKISTDSGTQDYNVAPMACDFNRTGRLVLLWGRRDKHAGTLVGEIMISRSVDEGTSWSTPEVLLPAITGKDRRDTTPTAFGNMVLVAATVFDGWGTDDNCYTEIHRSYDAVTFTEIGSAQPSNATVGTMLGYNRAVFNGSMRLLADGTLVCGGFETNSRQNSGLAFSRSVCWRSSDNGVTWSVVEIYPPTFSDTTDRSTLLRNPNETCITIDPDDGTTLVAFVRVSGSNGWTGDNGNSAELRRFESADGGLTWDAGAAVDFARWGQSLPYVQILPDGRWVLPHRNSALNHSSWAISTDKGVTWSDTLIFLDREYQEYTTLIPLGDGKTACEVYSLDDDAGIDEASVYTQRMHVFQGRDAAYEPSFLADCTALFDCHAFDGTSADAGHGQAIWTQDTSGHRPTLVASDATRPTHPFCEFDAADDHIYTGVPGDHNYLHDNSSAFHVAIHVNIPSQTLNTQLIGTATFSPSRVGFNLWLSSGYRLNLYVMDGSAPLVVDSSGGATGITENTQWQTIAIDYDLANYHMFVNGQLVRTIAAGTGHSVANSTAALSIAKDAVSTAAANLIQVSRALVINRQLTDQERADARRWLRS